MGGNIVYRTRGTTLIQMGTNANVLHGHFTPASQLGENDISAPQTRYMPQQQKPYTEQDRLRDQQAREQQIQL